MHNDKRKESLSPKAHQSTGDNLSVVPTETRNRLHTTTDGGSGQDLRRKVLDSLEHEVDEKELARWFLKEHGRFPNSATIAFFEAAAAWIEKAYRAGLSELPLSKVIPWMKFKK